MREIKFRAWDKRNKEMLIAHSFLIGADGKFYIDSGWDSITASRHSHEDYIVMQYTGLKDKNGKEIYEGDILGGKISGQSGNLAPYKVEIPDIYHLQEGGFYEDECEVIGNIYENPELL